MANFISELQMQAFLFQRMHNNYPEERGYFFRIKTEMDNHPYKTKKDIILQLGENKATRRNTVAGAEKL